MTAGAQRSSSEAEYQASVIAYLKRLPDAHVFIEPRLVSTQGRLVHLDALIEYQLPPDIRISVGVEINAGNSPVGVDQAAAVRAVFAAVGVDRGILFCTHGVTEEAKELLNSGIPKIAVVNMTLEGAIASVWSPDFLDAVPMLREAKTDLHPTQDLADRVCLAVERVPHYSRFFFYKLENRAWLNVFTARGVLRRALNRQNTIPVLAAAELPIRFVAEEPEAFLDFSSAVEGGFQWLETDLARAAVNLPRSFRREFCINALKWSFNDMADTEGVASLIQLEAAEGDIKMALDLHFSSVRLWADRDEGKSFFSSHDLRSNTDQYWFTELTAHLYPKLLPFGVEEVIVYVRSRLRQALDLAFPNENGNLQTWRVSRLDTEPSPVWDYLESSLFAYRDVLLASLSHDRHRTVEELVRAIKDDCYGAEARVALYVLSVRFSELSEVLPIVLGEDRVWNAFQFLPELTDLVERNWAAFDESAREYIADRVLNLRTFESSSAEPSERAEQIRKGQVVDWLLRLKRVGGVPSGLQARAEEILETYSEETGRRSPKTWHEPDFILLDPVPEEAKTYGSMAAAEVLSAVRSFVPSGGPLNEKTPEGVSRELRKEAGERPGEFVTQEWKSLPYAAYASALLDGVVESLQNDEVNFDVSLIVIRAREVLSAQYPTAQDAYVYGSTEWVLMSLARLMEALSRALSRSSDMAALRALSSLYDDVWLSRALPLRATIVHDWFTSALNDTGGMLSMALCRLSLWARRVELDEGGGAESRQEATELYLELRKRVELNLIGSSDDIVRAPLGFFFTGFYLLDKDWAETQSRAIFDQLKPVRWESPWSSHFYNAQRYRSVFAHLRPYYMHSLELDFPEGNSPTWAEQMGDDIAIFWMDGTLRTEEPLWHAFWNFAQEKTKRSGAGWIYTELKDAESWPKAELWWRAAYLASDGKRLGTHLDAYLRWLERIPTSVSLANIHPLLIAAIESEDRFITDDLYAFLGRRVLKEANLCADVLRAVATNDRHFILHNSVDKVKDLLMDSYEFGDSTAKDAVRDAVRSLLTRGAYAYEDLLEKIRA
ncbi:MAG: hypothetical protein EON58_01970 [Alphaproteobacteria bacterium]|nr:MAG: hypothetical protein EON58_01970 [Alphaproteobacteria bacterium]